MKYNKLVRDNISKIIKQKGVSVKTHIADDKEFWEKLKNKLEEEVREFIRSENEEELADILEIINAICEYKGIDKKKLENLRKKKAKERGKFSRRVILEGSD